MPEEPIKSAGENWTKEYSTCLWSPKDPFEMKFQMEKIVGLLLSRDEDRTSQLTYSGSDNPPFIGRVVQFRYEAALADRNWYSLQISAWVPRAWNTEAKFVIYADRAFSFLIRNIQIIQTLEPTGINSQELYQQRVHEAIIKEAKIASQIEDQMPIEELKQKILAELRSGMFFRTAHHEGGTTIYFDGKNFVLTEYGEIESYKGLGTENEVLECIRELYDWESRKSTFPHRPPELEVWEFIRSQLMR